MTDELDLNREPEPPPASHAEIALVAYYLWQEQGEPEGEAVANWYEAEAILRDHQGHHHHHHPRHERDDVD